ncbi:MAG TPA: hypothetical protein VLD57_10620 [Blastocatellia bacterium]|nr:hypothetical protein [Blastocatellia bacterium]
MDRGNAGGDALIALLRTSLAAEGAQAFVHMVLYTSFGVVRGRTGIAFAQEFAGESGGELTGGDSNEVIELLEAHVEHYSNHLPAASFERLYVRLADVRGFVLDLSQAQG